jgi:hypothetical protein
MAWRLLQYKGAYDRLAEECGAAVIDAIKPRLAMLQALGNQSKYPVTDSFGDGLFEVRAKLKRIQIRLLFGFLPGQRVVFVWGGLKKDRTLPPSTIREARRLLAEAQAVAEALHVVNFH